MKKRTPLQTAREFCKWCTDNNDLEIRNCGVDTCPLHKFRRGKGRIRLKDLRTKCLDCDPQGYKSIKNCQFDGKKEELCPIWAYRLGKRPPSTGVLKKVNSSNVDNLARYRKKLFLAKSASLQGKTDE